MKVVAPLVGAWIEMLLLCYTKDNKLVAPLVGAWIEIYICHTVTTCNRCRSPRGSVD